MYLFLQFVALFCKNDAFFQEKDILLRGYDIFSGMVMNTGDAFGENSYIIE